MADEEGKVHSLVEGVEELAVSPPQPCLAGGWMGRTY